MRALCRLTGLIAGPDLALCLLDLSEHGMRVILRDPLEPGQAVEVAFRGPRQHRPLTLAATTVWCQPIRGGDYCVGLVFRRPLGAAYLSTLAHA